MDEKGPMEFSIVIKGLKPYINIERGYKFSQECDKTLIGGTEAEEVKSLIDKILPELLIGKGVFSRVANSAKQDFAEKLNDFAAEGNFKYFYQLKKALSEAGEDRLQTVHEANKGARF